MPALLVKLSSERNDGTFRRVSIGNLDHLRPPFWETAIPRRSKSPSHVRRGKDLPDLMLLDKPDRLGLANRQRVHGENPYTSCPPLPTKSESLPFKGEQPSASPFR